MKRLPLFLVWFAAACLFAGDQPSDGTKRTTRDLTRWGTIVDPDGDCKMVANDDTLLIVVPGSATPHDLAPELDVMNAPRVLQRARGDFTIQVQVAGRFSPGDDSTQPGRTGYNGAALVAIADAQNVVTLARAALQRTGEDATHYSNFELRVRGNLERIGMTDDHALAKDTPVHLRLERRGNLFLGAVSADGITWTALTPKKVPSNWPQEVQIGLAAISTSREEFTPRFSKLQTVK